MALFNSLIVLERESRHMGMGDEILGELIGGVGWGVGGLLLLLLT